MESDLAQIKLLLWAILGLQCFFIVANIACRLLGCGRDSNPNYNELVDKGKYDEILSLTKRRLETHPHDADALYFRAKALIQSGLIESAKKCIRQLGDVDPRMLQASKEWLESLDQSNDNVH